MIRCWDLYGAHFQNRGSAQVIISAMVSEYCAEMFASKALICFKINGR